MTEHTTPTPQAPSGAPASSGASEPFANLRRRMERMFDDFQTGLPTLGRDIWSSDFATPMREWVGGDWGAVDLKETDAAYRFTVELPGCDEKDIDVAAANGMLTITAEKKEETSDEKEDAHITERRYGSFRRSFRLPEGVARDRIDAQYRKGVLEVTVPKTEEAKQDARRIPVKPA